MHLKVGKCVNKEFKSCAHKLRYTLNIKGTRRVHSFENHGAGFKIMHAGGRMYHYFRTLVKIR